jgi:hypothetical protein
MRRNIIIIIIQSMRRGALKQGVDEKQLSNDLVD